MRARVTNSISEAIQWFCEEEIEIGDPLYGYYDKPMDTVERYGEVGRTSAKIYDIHDLRQGMTVKIYDGSDTHVGEVVYICRQSDIFELECVVDYKSEEDTKIIEFDFYDCEVTCFS